MAGDVSTKSDAVQLLRRAVQAYLADSYAELVQFRLFVLYVAWRIDELKDYRAVRHDIAAVKVLTPKVLHDISQRAIQVHGALATTNELALGEMFSGSMILGLADGPTEIHRTTVAKALLKRGTPAEGMWPSSVTGRAECAASNRRWGTSARSTPAAIRRGQHHRRHKRR